MLDAHGVFHKIDQRGAMRVDERLARRPDDELRDADGVMDGKQRPGDLCIWGPSANGRIAGIRATFFSASIAAMAGNGASMIV